MPPTGHDAAPVVATLGNGARVVVYPLPWLDSVSLSVFVRTGSQHERRRENGISHVVEHMAFKGTATRDCQRINLDAERLGAEVNAHTDKDHTAFHMHGLAQHAGEFIAMLGDIVRHGSFPADELERERQVILHELTDDEDDPMSAAYKLFDRACFGTHAVAQPVIGTRANIERFTRDDLLAYVQRQYSGENLVLGVAGRVDPDAMLRAAEQAFGGMPRGEARAVAEAPFLGGLKQRRHAGSSQSHVVLGFPLPSLRADDCSGALAAAVLGEGMSSPLLDQVRERRGLAYYTACSADVLDSCGQFVIEASTAPAQLDEFLAEVARLLRAQAERIAPVDFERARNQLAVRSLRAQERPFRRLEDAAQDLFVHGRVRPRSEWIARMQAVPAEAVRLAFERMLARPAALALVGKLVAGAPQRFVAQLASG
ncbi:MAG: insulinase family protein [Burkholderiales bacterium]|nr:insulinase family protein [Burkholderiales bacterium]